MSWDLNPWKVKPTEFGSRFFGLIESDDPVDQAQAAELWRLGEVLWGRVLERYPELAVPERNIPADRNGFLKLLELAERFEALGGRGADLKFPEELKKHLDGKGEWDSEAVRAWLAQEQVLLEELRAIGLMPDRSISGVYIEPRILTPGRFARSAAELLLLDAHLAAEEGDLDRALNSVRAANGLADHFGKVETPSLLGLTIQVLIKRSVQSYALHEIIPSIWPKHRDLDAWESALNPEVMPPSEMARALKGEWNITSRTYIMPMLSDRQDPKYPSDPMALIDYHAGNLLQLIEAFDSESPADWANFSYPRMLPNSHLSNESRKIFEMSGSGAVGWSNGFAQMQSQSAMTQAAFAIMKNEPIPNDPIYGLPYQWDPSTRTLSAPASADFPDQNLEPIVVPRP